MTFGTTSRFERRAALLCAAAVLLFDSCKNSAPGDALSDAYVAPASLNVRRELREKNATVAVLHYGDRVWILDTRRRFVRVRTMSGAEGWIDATQLLTPEQMAGIRRETARELQLPSEGAAGVFEALNVHLEPSRVSPSFTRIPEGASVDVLARKLVPKADGPAKTPVFTVNKPQAAKRERKKKETRVVFPLPKLAPPGPPPDLEELSRPHFADSTPKPAEKAPPKPPPVMESWTLVRTKDKQAGWVLSRNLTMSIPDEVAQYAEGKHITSYFSLGAVQDEEKGRKSNWLWTTESAPANYDFDSWRVFIWNRRRHRYETSYRERDVEGYFPVHVDAAEDGTPARTFQLVMRDDDGRLYRRSYAFDGIRVHMTAKESVTSPDAPPALSTANRSAADVQPKSGPLGSFWSNLKGRLTRKH